MIVNAGGIVAYYPSRVPLHRPAEHLGGRDLFGELSRAERSRATSAPPGHVAPME